MVQIILSHLIYTSATFLAAFISHMVQIIPNKGMYGKGVKKAFISHMVQIIPGVIVLASISVTVLFISHMVQIIQ